MRIDHHAYQRATRVGILGFLVQFGAGLVLLLFGLLWHDVASQFASMYVLAGVLVWLGLIIIFHQHKLERLEALEEDELASTRGGGAAGSFFDRAVSETRVAARRLALMHKWLMPVLSIILAVALAGLAWGLLRYMKAVQDGARAFTMTDERGWAVAICLSIAAVSFVFSRYVAGMAKQTAWQNLRGGAAYMVGNALVMVAVAAGIVFRFFQNDAVIQAVAWAIPIFMIGIALEIVLNFILNLYRPRIAGEVPRPAFDSKALSLLSTPDSIVRSLNEAVNYQFGFDVTSSWGYQLLLRSFVWLVVLGVLALVLMSTMVVVEPHQRAIRLRGGKLINDQVYDSGMMWKLPWPIETAAVYDVTRIRTLHLTPKVLADLDVHTWAEAEPPKTDAVIEPFVVGAAIAPGENYASNLLPFAPALGVPQPASTRSAAVSLDDSTPDDAQAEEAVEYVSHLYSLIDAEIILQYRIRADAQGLLEFLSFASEAVARLQTLTDRERALKAIALGQVSGHLSKLTLDKALSPGLSNLSQELRGKIQAAFDDRQTGVEVVAVDLPMLRPSGKTAQGFEDLGHNKQTRLQFRALAERDVSNTFTTVIGDASLADKVLTGIDDYNRLLNEKGSDDQAVIVQRQIVEGLLFQGGGEAAQTIAQAEAERWRTLMDERSRVSRWQAELDSYAAAPELYCHREIMKVYEGYLPLLHKYIIAIDPSRVNVDMDLKDINPLLEFSGASEEEINE